MNKKMKTPLKNLRIYATNVLARAYLQSTHIGRDETGSVYLPTAILLVRENVMSGGGRAPPTLTSQD